MKIAIHHRKGSFSDRWIAYCKKNKIDYLIVDCYRTDIIILLKQEKVTHLMWHFSHELSKDLMVFPYVLNSADKIGIKTFPNFITRWHFDNKVAQKYLLESINAPLVKSYVFYDKIEALNFIMKFKLPIISKLKRGAGSTNVKLITNLKEGQKYINELFGPGIVSTAKPLENFSQKYRVAKQIKNPKVLFKKILNYLKKNKRERTLANNEKGYAYFQKFMPNNDFDTRIIVVGDKAFGIRRFNKKNDFRASGSGMLDYDVNKIDLQMVSIAFETSAQIGAQCLAYDFIYDLDKKPKIVEVCFGFSMLAYDKCEGYWNSDLSFQKVVFNPQEFMLINFIS